MPTEHRSARLHPCVLTAGALRALCENQTPDAAELAALKVRSVRMFADEHEVTCRREDIAALGGVVTLDGRFTTQPRELPAGELRALCNNAPHAQAPLLLKLLATLADVAAVILDQELLSDLESSIERRNARRK